MSVILQSFLHNPLLRSYFLSDRHNRDLCPISNPTTSFSGSGNGSGSSSNGAAGGKGEEGDKPCLSCEMDRLFSEVRRFFSFIFLILLELIFASSNSVIPPILRHLVPLIFFIQCGNLPPNYQVTLNKMLMNS